MSDLSAESAKTERFVHDLTENARRIYAYIFSLVPNWADADEIFQETSATIWAKYDEYRPGTGFREWAFRIAYFKVLQFRKAQGKNVLRFSDPVIDAVDRDTQVGGELWARRHRLLGECYQQLRPQDKELIDLRYEPGATTRKVAELVGRSVDAVYKALNRIHEQLLNCIDSKLEELP
ncbi:MAG: sigma-70 family RNA polymerase sigma factor [Pirellulales bacterium]|nr:sigma-70 family RNA polymerase sigma factor [Pirellulales bacterium]